MKRSALQSWAILLFATLGVARGQLALTAPQPDEARADALQRTDTYVNDSFEAQEILKRFQLAVEKEDWLSACRHAEALIDRFGRRLVEIRPGVYESVVGRVARESGEWPARGRAFYESYFATQIESGLESHWRDRNLDGLLTILETHPGLEVATDGAAVAWELALEAGNFDLARRICLNAVQSADVLDGAFAARLAVTSALDGDAEGARAWLDRHTSEVSHTGAAAAILWQGERRQPVALVDELLSEVNAFAAAVHRESDAWGMFGGGATRAGVGTFDYDTVAMVWRFDDFAAGALDFLEAPSDSNGFRQAALTGRHLTLNPVVGSGLVVFNDSNDVWAIQESTGRASWHFGGDGRNGDGRYGSGDQSVSPWHSPAVVGSRVFACLGGEVGGYYAYENETSASLVCLEAESGRLLWRASSEALGGDFAKTHFGSAPLATDDSVYVVARRRRTFGFEDCYLARLRAEDGALLSRTHLGSASTGGFGYRRSTLSMAAMADGVVYVAGNLGTVGAVDARTGRVRWLMTYDRSSASEWRHEMRSTTSESAPWHYNPVMVVGDQLLVRPSDAEVLLVLNRSDGSVVRSIDVEQLGGLDTIVGAAGSRLYGVGSSVYCYDWIRNEMVWSSSLSRDAILFGRGAMASDRVLIPTDRGLAAYRILDGSLSEQPWDATGGGNLVALPDRILVAGAQHVSSYGRKADVWSRLRQEIQRRPADPAPALDLAEIALRAEAWADAREALHTAFERFRAGTAEIDDATVGRLFDDCMAFARQWPRESEEHRSDVALFFSFAGQCAPDPPSHVLYRLTYASHLASESRPTEAVDVLQQTLIDRSLRDVEVMVGGEWRHSGNVARERIGELVAAHGRDIAKRHDAEADRWLQAARSSGDLDLLDRVVETYPVSPAASVALTLKADLLMSRGDAIGAASALTTAYMRYGSRANRAQLVLQIAECFAAAGRFSAADAWLSRGDQRHPSTRVESDGEVLTFDAALDRFRKSRGSKSPRRPRLDRPLRTHFERRFSEEASVLAPLIDVGHEADYSRVFVYSDHRVYAYRPGDGGAVWNDGARCDGRAELLFSTARQAVFAARFEIFAVAADRGEVLWRHGERPEGADEATSDPEDFARWTGHAYRDGRLVSVLDDGRAACVEVGDGRVVWRGSLEHRPTGRLALSDRLLVYRGVGAGVSQYCVVERETGKLLRTIEIDVEGHLLRLHVTPDERLLAVYSRRVSCYDLASGRRLWHVGRGENVLDATVQFDLDGVYLSDDGLRMEKLSLDDGRTVWTSDPLFEAHGEALSTALVGDNLIVMTDSDVVFLDAVGGRVAREGRMLADVHFVRHFVSESSVVSIDGPVRGRGGSYAVYRFALPGSGRAEDVAMSPLGTFDDVRGFMLYDGAVIADRSRMFLGWSVAGADAP